MKQKRIRCNKCGIVDTMTFELDETIEHDIHWKAECPECGTLNYVVSMTWDEEISDERK